jgi:Tfp pilus assembly protein PilF
MKPIGLFPACFSILFSFMANPAAEAPDVLLAEAYPKDDRPALAEENVRKALELDPENEEAKKTLEKPVNK